jgi:ribosomal protein L11 methyltransferase
LGVPYRLDVHTAPDDALHRLVELGAIDIEATHDRGVAALMPDSVPPEQVRSALRVSDVSISRAVGRDAGSVWVLNLRPIRIGGLRIVPADGDGGLDALRLIDAAAFGTGLHPTTALCLEAIEEAVSIDAPAALLDVGTGSGVLALGALMMGVPRAMGIDIDAEALRVAAENARINGLDARLQLARGGPEAIAGTWPLVVANVLAAPLIDMAPALVRRMGHQGRLILSGIHASIEPDVQQAYRRLGMRGGRVSSRAGWVAIVMETSW